MGIRIASSEPVRVLSVLLVFVTGAGCGGGDSLGFSEEKAVYSKFDEGKAYSHVEKLVGFGPRPAGSVALEDSRKYIEKVLDEAGWDVSRHAFQSSTPEGVIEFVNLRCRVRRGGNPADWLARVSTVVGSHYDTKLYKTFEFVGANDGGSSTGLLLEFARVAAERPALAEELELVFFDGEEAFINYSATDGLYGSREYGKLLRSMPEEVRPEFGIVFDMVGDKSLKLTLPTNSSRRLIGFLYEAAAELGTRSAFGAKGGPILDDHVPLENAGLEVINIIDLDYPVWHTAGDTMEQVSAESLGIVGRAGILMIEKYLLGGGGSR